MVFQVFWSSFIVKILEKKMGEKHLPCGDRKKSVILQMAVVIPAEFIGLGICYR